MSRSNRDVGGYRGRRTMNDILKLIAIALAVAVVLVLAGAFVLQRYMVYTDEGPRLDLPPIFQMFRQRGEEPAASSSLPDPADVSLIEEDPVPPEPEPAGYALELPVEDAVSGAAAGKLEGARALILEVKDQLGRLSWRSGQATADWSEVNGAQETGDALKEWNEGEVCTIARLHCFRDDTVPYYNNSFALRWAGQDWNWRDELGLRWTSPGRAEVRAYNAALCGEAAALGFDEIVLEEFYFPIQGNLDAIRPGESYDSARFAAQVEDFLAQAQAAVEPFGTKLSLRVGRDTLAGLESSSGVTAQLLEKYAYRIWVEDDGLTPTPLNLLEQAGITGGTERLVLITPRPEENSPVFQAVLSAGEDGAPDAPGI